jgi:Tfp pilus assembly major pilin PilA
VGMMIVIMIMIIIIKIDVVSSYSNQSSLTTECEPTVYHYIFSMMTCM